MTIKENEQMRKLIDEWNSYYQIDDDCPEKKESAKSLLNFIDTLSEPPNLCKEDWEIIMGARIFNSF